MGDILLNGSVWYCITLTEAKFVMFGKFQRLNNISQLYACQILGVNEGRRSTTSPQQPCMVTRKAASIPKALRSQKGSLCNVQYNTCSPRAKKERLYATLDTAL